MLTSANILGMPYLPKRAEQVACPRCAAEPGVPCASPTSDPHIERVLAYQTAEEPND